ncbi:hypothetical protein ACFFTN_25150 [Aminobacter aganoensis]|uniref:J domain-containing protein n=1 Tax=Aminobacter aganoensis TaxID=83264 RepID=A0A7X0KL04_9HYPH|nr:MULTISPECIES: hypothetical protein [Aminobacter]KQU75313.1 hypothetical protein ASC75_18345 [Aminobacter sp. DSM 101952]MBB6354553.1 hypothetical protein [Aminobacter aganoensis]
MGTGINRDFASLLDDLFVASEPGEVAPAPTIPFDYLAVADELHSGRIRVAGETVAAEYREAGAALEDEFVSLLDMVKADAKAAAVQEPEPPSIDPEVIAAELGLADAKPADLARMRRIFALANHPDRVAPHLRQRAMVRMQLANMMIDDAKRRGAKKKS